MILKSKAKNLHEFITWYLKYKLQLNINFEIVYDNNWIIVKIKALLSFKKNSIRFKSARGAVRTLFEFYRPIFELIPFALRFRHTLATTIMNYSTPCESARNSPRKRSRISPHHLGNPLLALREMRCVLHLNAGHLELSGCVPFFLSFFFCNIFHAPGNFAKRGDRSSPGTPGGVYVGKIQEMWRNFV